MQDYKSGAEWFYNYNKHKGYESYSGVGSSLIETYKFREWLKLVIRNLDIKSISDCPCGDWNWMSAVKLDNIEYVGYDILDVIVESNREKYPKYKFEKFDAVVDGLPQSDLIISRDFFQYLNDDLFNVVLSNFRSSGSKFLVSTTFSTESEMKNPEFALNNFGLFERHSDIIGETINTMLDKNNKCYSVFKLN